MQTKTYTVYSFDELSPEAKEKAIEKLRDINVDFDDWHESVLDWYQDELLPERGFEDAKISYSGFWSQGDGASFTASVDAAKFIRFYKLGNQFRSILNAINTGAYIGGKVYRTDYHYSHEYTVGVELDVETSFFYGRDAMKEIERVDRIEAQTRELENVVLEKVRELSREIYRTLEKEYDYLTSKEAVIETIEANEYEFTASGRLDCSHS